MAEVFEVFEELTAAIEGTLGIPAAANVRVPFEDEFAQTCDNAD
jgi:hypothetical protein